MRKTTETIASFLGITQRQMALLLQVPRSQWSMYEIGKRNLPLKIKQLLAEMLAFLRVEEKYSDVQKHRIAQEESTKVCLEELLKDKEWLLYDIGKKIKQLEQKYETSLTAIGFVAYIRTRPHIRKVLDGELLRVICAKAERALQKSGLADLTLLKIKEEALQLEKLLISSQLNKIGRTLEELRSGNYLTSKTIAIK